MSRSGVCLVFALSILAAGLVACATPDEVNAADQEACRKLGFAPRSLEFTACVRDRLASRYTPPPPGWNGPGLAYAPGLYLQPGMLR